MKVIRVEDAERYEPEPGWMRANVCNEENISLHLCMNIRMSRYV
jgi:hypothetical protein